MQLFKIFKLVGVLKCSVGLLTQSPVHTYSLLLGGLDMGYLGAEADFPLGQDAASMAPPTTVRKAPAQAMKMADPNSYLHGREKKKGKY